MGDTRESFPTLEDIDNGNAGAALSQAVEGDTITGRNAAPQLVAKKDDDTLVYLRLDDAGNLRVTSDSASECKRAGTDGTPVAGSNSKTQVAEIALTVAKTYRHLQWSVCNFRDTIYEIELIDDPSGTPSVVQSLEIIVGPGDYTDSGESHCFEFDTTGLTSPVLRLSGKNLNAVSDFRGHIAIEEDAA